MLRDRVLAKRRSNVLFFDDFNRANAANLGGNWTNRVVSADQFIITANRAGGAANGNMSLSTPVTLMPSANHKVSATIGPSNLATEGRWLYLNSNISNQLLAFFYDSGGCDIGVHTGTYATSTAYAKQNLVDGSGHFVSGDVLSLECSAGVVLAKVNGTVVSAWADNYVTSHYPFADSSHREVGMGVSGQGASDGFTDFTAQNISAAGDGSVRAFDNAGTTTAQAANFTQTWFNNAYTAGYRLFVCDATNTDRSGAATAWSETSQQLGKALTAGMKIAAYSRNPELWNIGIGACAPYISQLQFWCLDIETRSDIPGATYTINPDVTPYTVANINGFISGMASSYPGVRPLIYTGNWTWPSVVAGAVGSTFASVPLWDSVNEDSSITAQIWKPDFTPHLQVPLAAPFAGWNTPSTFRKGAQQCLDVTLNGQLIDVSSFDSAFLV